MDRGRIDREDGHVNAVNVVGRQSVYHFYLCTAIAAILECGVTKDNLVYILFFAVANPVVLAGVGVVGVIVAAVALEALGGIELLVAEFLFAAGSLILERAVIEGDCGIVLVGCDAAVVQRAFGCELDDHLPAGDGSLMGRVHIERDLEAAAGIDGIVRILGQGDVIAALGNERDNGSDRRREGHALREGVQNFQPVDQRIGNPLQIDGDGPFNNGLVVGLVDLGNEAVLV